MLLRLEVLLGTILLNAGLGNMLLHCHLELCHDYMCGSRLSVQSGRTVPPYQVRGLHLGKLRNELTTRDGSKFSRIVQNTQAGSIHFFRVEGENVQPRHSGSWVYLEAVSVFRLKLKISSTHSFFPTFNLNLNAERRWVIPEASSKDRIDLVNDEEQWIAVWVDLGIPIDTCDLQM